MSGRYSASLCTWKLLRFASNSKSSFMVVEPVFGTRLYTRRVNSEPRIRTLFRPSERWRLKSTVPFLRGAACNAVSSSVPLPRGAGCNGVSSTVPLLRGAGGCNAISSAGGDSQGHRKASAAATVLLPRHASAPTASHRAERIWLPNAEEMPGG